MLARGARVRRAGGHLPLPPPGAYRLTAAATPPCAPHLPVADARCVPGQHVTNGRHLSRTGDILPRGGIRSLVAICCRCVILTYRCNNTAAAGLPTRVSARRSATRHLFCPARKRLLALCCAVLYRCRATRLCGNFLPPPPAVLGAAAHYAYLPPPATCASAMQHVFHAMFDNTYRRGDHTSRFVRCRFVLDWRIPQHSRFTSSVHAAYVDAPPSPAVLSGRTRHIPSTSRTIWRCRAV